MQTSDPLEPIIALTYKGQKLAMPFSVFVAKMQIENIEEFREICKTHPEGHTMLGNEQVDIQYIERIDYQLLYRVQAFGIKFITE